MVACLLLLYFTCFCSSLCPTHSLQAMLLLCVARCNGDIAEYAKAHGPRRQRVVSGRAADGKGRRHRRPVCRSAAAAAAGFLLPAGCHNIVNQRQHCSRGKEGVPIGAAGHIGGCWLHNKRLPAARAARGCEFQGGHVLFIVDCQDVGAQRGLEACQLHQLRGGSKAQQED